MNERTRNRVKQNRYKNDIVHIGIVWMHSFYKEKKKAEAIAGPGLSQRILGGWKAFFFPFPFPFSVVVVFWYFFSSLSLQSFFCLFCVCVLYVFMHSFFMYIKLPLHPFV